MQRRRLSLIVVLVAAAASVATSPEPFGFAGEPVDGPVFTLDEETPVRVFSVVAIPNGPATRRGVDRGTVNVDYRFAAAAASEIEIECQRPDDEEDREPSKTRHSIEPASGGRVGAVDGRSLAVFESYEAFGHCSDHESFCRQDLLLRFQHEGGGPVEVEWSVWGHLSLFESGDPLPGAKIDVTITPADDG